MKESENKDWLQDDDPKNKAAKDILTERAIAEKERGTDFIKKNKIDLLQSGKPSKEEP